MKTVCPQCKQKYEIDNAYNGFEIQCPYCETNFIVQKICTACDGLGVKYTDDSHKEICKTCDGAGIIVSDLIGDNSIPKKQTAASKFETQSNNTRVTHSSNNTARQKTCWRCDGLGRKYTNGGNGEICHVCNGSGVIYKTSGNASSNIPSISKNKSEFATQNSNTGVTHSSNNTARQKTCWRCDGLGRKYTNGGNGEICHVCNGWGEIYESSGSLYQNQPRSSKSSSDFDSSIIKGGCGSTVLLILYIIGGLIASVCLMGTAHSGNEKILCILGYIVITLIFAGFAFLFLLETWSKKITVSLLCFFIVFLIFCGVKGKRLGTSDFESHKRTNTANSGIPTEEELMYPMDGEDPKNWRKHEEDLENRLPHLKNAPYACKRCGMKSDRPLDDLGGRNGVCADCINYLRSKR